MHIHRIHTHMMRVRMMHTQTMPMHIIQMQILVSKPFADLLPHWERVNTFPMGQTIMNPPGSRGGLD